MITCKIANICFFWLQDKSLDMKATFREILIMLSVFDTIFVLSATISFSLPIMSSQWRVGTFLLFRIKEFKSICLNMPVWKISHASQNAANSKIL